jgi:hypothetical protein
MDNGLVQGLAEGLSAGLSAFKDEKRRQEDLAYKAEEREAKKAYYEYMKNRARGTTKDGGEMGMALRGLMNGYEPVYGADNKISGWKRDDNSPFWKRTKGGKDYDREEDLQELEYEDKKEIERIKLGRHLTPEQTVAEKEKDRLARIQGQTYGKLSADQTINEKAKDRESRQFGRLSAEDALKQKEADRINKIEAIEKQNQYKLTPEQTIEQKEAERKNRLEGIDRQNQYKLNPDQTIEQKEADRVNKLEAIERQNKYKLTPEQTMAEKEADRASGRYGKLSADQVIAEKDRDRENSRFGKLSAEQLLQKFETEIASLEKRAAMGKDTPEDKIALENLKFEHQKIVTALKEDAALDRVKQQGSDAYNRTELQGDSAYDRAELQGQDAYDRQGLINKGALEREKAKPYSSESRLKVEQERSRNRLDVEALRDEGKTKRATIWGNPNEAKKQFEILRQEQQDEIEKLKADKDLLLKGFEYDEKTGKYVLNEKLRKQLFPDKTTKGTTPKAKDPDKAKIDKLRIEKLERDAQTEDEFPKMSEGQAKVAVWGQELREALDVMRKLRKKGYKRETIGEGAMSWGSDLPMVGGLIESGLSQSGALSPDAKEWLRAERLIKNANLRFDTGAAVTVPEEYREKLQLITAGDTDMNIEGKLKKIEDRATAFEQISGRGGRKIREKIDKNAPGKIDKKAPGRLAPKSGERRQYSKSMNKTRVLDASGKVLRVLDGDQR